MATWSVESVTHMSEAEQEGQSLALAHYGVSFGAWAFVLAGLGDGLPEDDLFSHLDLDEDRWQRADAAFNDALLHDVEAGGTLSEALDAAMRRARRSWTRAIPPLGAWLSFYRAWAADTEPMALLARHGLRAADIHRLQDFWRARLANEPSLQEEALKILSSAPGPLPTPRPETPRLAAALREDSRPGTTGPLVRRRGDGALPFTAGEAAPAPPPLSVPLPPSRRVVRRTNAEQTRVTSGDDEVSVAFLPFAPREDDVEPADAPAQADALSEPNSGVPAEADPVQRFTVQQYAALCGDLMASAGAHPAVLERYEITALQKAELDAYWTQKMSQDAAIWLAWDRALAECSAASLGEVESTE